MAKKTDKVFSFNSWLIRAKRESLGLSQEELGRKAKLSRFVIMRAEAGDDSKSRALARIAKALDIPLPVLYDPQIKQGDIFKLQSLTAEAYRASAT